MHAKKTVSVELSAQQLRRGNKSDLGHRLTSLPEQDRKDRAKVQSPAGARRLQSRLKPVVNMLMLLSIVFLPSVS